MYNYCTVGMTREQAVTMAKKLGFSEECVDEVTLLMFHPFSGLSTVYIAGNFQGRKFSQIGRKGAFCGENFRGMLKLLAYWVWHA